jgi:hypothetical protein
LRGRHASILVAVGAAFMFPGILLGGQSSPNDLPGVISAKDSYSGTVALKPADVQFYLKIERAALDRYQRPTPEDLKDMAEANRLRHLEAVGTAKMTEEMKKSGNMQKAVAEMFQATREQQALMRHADDLVGYVPRMLAREAGMPADQWDNLTKAVEDSAGMNDEYNNVKWGSGGDSGAPKPSSDQVAAAVKAAADRKQVAAANRQLVAPNAAEIKKMHELTLPIIEARGRAVQAAMTP